MTTYLTLLCLSIADGSQICLPINSQALCEQAMEQAVEELYPEYGLDLYVGCKKTGIVTTSPRPKPKPEVN
jgi:hypothetical protein